MYSVDIHAHFFTRGYIDTLNKYGHKVDWSVEYKNDGSVIMSSQDNRPVGPIDPSYFDINARLEGLDRQETDLHALSLTNPMCHFSDDSLNLDLAQAYNDGTSEFHVAHPDRFVGLITLPMLNADDAITELERAARLPGSKGVYMGTNIAGHNLSEERFESIFDKIAELYGAKGFRVERSSEINEAVKAALKCNKPAVIDVAIDPKALYSFRRDTFKHRTK